MPDQNEIHPDAPQIGVALAPYVAPTAEKRAFLAALAIAQGQFDAVTKNRDVEITGREGRGSYKFSYAELGEILRAVRPALAANGMSLRGRIVPGDSNVWIQSILAHQDGYEDISELILNISAEDLKTVGGRISYLRRYMQVNQLNIAAEDDIDGDGNDPGDVSRNAPPAPRAAPQRKAPAAAPKAAPAQAQAPAEPPAQAPAADVDNPLLQSYDQAELKAKFDREAAAAAAELRQQNAAQAREKVVAQAQAPAAAPTAAAEPINPNMAKWLRAKLALAFDDDMQGQTDRLVFLRRATENPAFTNADIETMPAALFEKIRPAVLALG